MDEHEPALAPKANQEQGEGAEENRGVLEALDGLGMLPLTASIPINMVMPEVAASEQATEQTETNLELV